MTREDAEAILAEEYRNELSHLYNTKEQRDRKGRVIQEAKERSWDSWLEMARNSPASINAILRAANDSYR